MKTQRPGTILSAYSPGVCAIAMALLLACASGKNYTPPAAEATEGRKMAELERKLDNQTSRLNQLIALQDSINQLQKSMGGGHYETFGIGGFDTLTTKQMFFDVDEFLLNEDNQKIMDIIASQMAEYPRSLLQITGHTDKTGRVLHNQLLSQERAESARRFLTDKYGVPLHRMGSLGYGWQQQRYPNDTGNLNNKNRRIELVLLVPAQASTMP